MKSDIIVLFSFLIIVFFSVDIQEQSSAKKGESEKNYEALQKM